MITLEQPLITMAASAAEKATAILIVATVSATAARRASASARHQIWALGLGLAFLLPLLSAALPHWDATIPAPRVHHEAPVAPALLPMNNSSSKDAAGAHSVAAHPSVTNAAPTEADMPSTAPASLKIAHIRPASTLPISVWLGGHWEQIALVTWLMGSLVVMGRLALGLHSVTRIGRASRAVETGPLAVAASAAMAALGVHGPTRVRQSLTPGRLNVPVTWGVRPPIVLLPSEAGEWPAERVTAAMLHEMGHIRRWDWALQIAACFVCAIYWFHPLVWLAARKMREESETACDDLAVLSGVPAHEYARHLLDIALGARGAGLIGMGAVAMARTARVEGRLRSILAAGLARRPMTRRATIAGCAAALVIALPLAAIRLSATTPAIPVPDADQLQLTGDFTLRYAVTITDTKPRKEMMREFESIKDSYRRALQADPHMQPVPGEYYAPFSYYQSLRPKVRHLVLTVSAWNGSLLWQSEENGEISSLLYNGRSTQRFTNGHAGASSTGIDFAGMTDCPLPAVGLPAVPLMKQATSDGDAGPQTWRALCPIEGAVIKNGEAVYVPGRVQATREAGIWKVTNVDTADQEFQFLSHQRFQGLWLASQMRLIRYFVDMPPSGSIAFAPGQDAFAWLKAHRAPSETSEYRLISATNTPVDFASLTRSPQSRVSTVDVARQAAQNARNDQQWRIDQALKLRYYHLDWAYQHRTLLLSMARSRPEDLTSAAQVCRSLQALPFPLWDGDARPGHVWDGDPRVEHDRQLPYFAISYPQGLTLAHLQRSSEPADRRVREEFAKYHDVRIAESIGGRNTTIILWASGRITRSILTDRYQGHGKPFLTSERQTEIVKGFFEE